MDANFYYEAVDRMQKSNVDPEYLQGWIGGYMGNPPREEQRVTPAYEAGYEAGRNKDTEDLTNWSKDDH